MQKTALVCGGHGFIGHHMAKKLKSEGYWVRTVDIEEYTYGNLDVDDYVIGDLTNKQVALDVTLCNGEPFDEVYQFAYWMGGAGVIFTGNYDAIVMHDSALLDLNVIDACKINKAKKVYSASSACVYPDYNQSDPNNPNCEESSAYPASPDSDYGFTKLFGERLCDAYRRNYGLNIKTCRFHNIFGIESTWEGGKEKAPAAVCRKVAECPDGGEIEIWGSGEQTRSFLYIDECIEAVRRYMNSDCNEVLNIGSEEMISINNLAKMAIEISGKNITIKNVDGPLGVMGRNSDNKLIKEKLGWEPNYPLRKGMEKTYAWVKEQVDKR